MSSKKGEKLLKSVLWKTKKRGFCLPFCQLRRKNSTPIMHLICWRPRPLTPAMEALDQSQMVHCFSRKYSLADF